MTNEEKVYVAAVQARSAGRRVLVVTAGPKPGSAALVGLAMVDELLMNTKDAVIWSIPHRDAVLLLKDLQAALEGTSVEIDEAMLKKGPRA